MQSLLKKNTFSEGIDTLIRLRGLLMQEADSWRTSLSPVDFCAIPFINADGYHSKTVAYSLWHIFRIEDIVVNTLIRRQPQILFAGDHAQRMHAPIITTGNELVKQEIADFSRQLEIDALYAYIHDVQRSTDEWLRTLGYADLKISFTEADKVRLRRTKTVSEDAAAAWLIDYWCGKDVGGLLKMPLSRHWIMHIEAANRIRAKINGSCRTKETLNP